MGRQYGIVLVRNVYKFKDGRRENTVLLIGTEQAYNITAPQNTKDYTTYSLQHLQHLTYQNGGFKRQPGEGGEEEGGRGGGGGGEEEEEGERPGKARGRRRGLCRIEKWTISVETRSNVLYKFS